MLELTLLDALAILFVFFRLARSHDKALGDSLHNLIALSLIVALLMGLRLTSEIRDLLGDMAGFINTIPGFGSKLLIVILAWYLMRLLRKRAAYWIEEGVPDALHRPLTRWSETLRALLLVGLVTWLAEGWFAPSGPGSPMVVKAVRQGDAWIATLVDPGQRPSLPSAQQNLSEFH